MNNINEQANEMLRSQIKEQAKDPLNDVRREAVSHVLTRVLGSDGFTIFVVSTKGNATSGLAVAGGTIPGGPTLSELLRMLEAVSHQFGIELEVTLKTPANPDHIGKFDN